MSGSGKRWAAAAVAVAAAALALFLLFRGGDGPRGAVDGIFKAVSEGRLEEALSFVDPRSELALYWNEDRYGIQTRAREALRDWQVGFDLELKERIGGDAAEVRLEKGTMKLSSRSGESRGAYPVSLDTLELVFYLEKKEGRWLVTGINYDLEELAQQLSF